ncbi:SH3-like domain-containing protein [Lactobacillus kullabergensis]|uniref:SH3-like domain-containing protein n=1 Tax=Lactobacillus kullabergensis TaxID=1218493 RepID=UPI0022482F6D|nr:SH3-like domain-containing protein [Lactobacillus kullabergensis]MCX0290789.1 SH3-like domain-containing protein [Lactobacillus kullabergensis]
MKLYKKTITYLLTLVAGLLIYTGFSTTSVAADSSSTQPPVQDDSNKSSNSSTDANSDNTDANKSGQTDQNGTDDQDNIKPKPKQVVTGFAMMTKVAGNKNYKVWKEVKDGKVNTKVADGINFQYSHIQSDQLIETKKYRYWRIYVNGREVGYVNENYFDRNKIAVPKTVTLVRNEFYDFSPRDAISYVTNSMGTVIDNSQVIISKDSINCGTPKTYKVKYTYGDATATVKVTVRKSTKEGIVNADTFNSFPAQPGTNDYQAWKTHYGSSLNYVSPTEYSPEDSKHTLTSGNLTLKTKFYQPVLLSVADPTDDNINRVGHIPEGVTVSDGWAYTSLLSHTDVMSGHIVGYDLNKLTSPYNAQHLLDMTQKKFNNYVKHIKVSPYIPIGHGQAMGSSDKYIYVLNNDNTLKDTNDSEELIQIRKSDLQINKIWTIKTWIDDGTTNRYFHNGVMISDYDMYTVYHDSENNCYEYWEFTRKGDNWYPKLVGKTDGNFVNNNSPVQGFTYDPKHKNFYLAFNDLIFKIGRNGKIKDTYSFDTGREIEGISVSDNKLYVNLAQRAELLVSMNIN